MKNKEYWKNRIEKEEQETYDLSLEEVERQYKVLRDTEFEIKQVIKRYMNDLSANNLNENIANMEKILESDELEEFKWTYEKYVENAKKYSELVDKSNEYAQKLDRQLKNASLRYRISKKQAMLSEIQQEIALHTNKRNKLLENHLKQVSNNTKEPTNKQINIYSESFKSVEEAVKQKWIGNKNFSDRIWNDSERLIKKLEDKLPQTIATGNIKQLINEIKKEFKVSKYNAKRLVLTESARIFNKTRLKNYEDLGVEKVEIIATLDLRTSNICRSRDKSIVELKNAKIGVDLPPFHPNCRTVFIPLLEYEGSTRISRDINTNKNNILKDKSYNEWVKEVGEKEHNIAQQKLKNKKSDLKQYRKYKVALNNSKYLPKTFEDFQNIKYNNNEEYESINRDYKVLKVIYKNKKIPSVIVAKELYYIFKENGNWLSDHFIERFIERGIKNNDFSIDIVFEISKKEVNYLDENGKNVRFYDGIAIISEIEDGIEKFITIIKGRKGKKWTKIEK